MKFQEIYTKVMGENLPADFNYEIGNGSETFSAGIINTVYISKTHYQKLLELYELLEKSTNDPEIITRIRVYISTFVQHEGQHISNQRPFQPFLESTWLYFLPYIVNWNNFQHYEEISAVKAQVDKIRSVNNGELNEIALRELSSFIVYTEFTANYDEIVGSKGFKKIQSIYPKNAKFENFALSVITEITLPNSKKSN